MTVGKQPPGRGDLRVATREVISLESEESGHTSVLRAPAWDAQLEPVEATAVHLFETNRERCGGFLLPLQTPELEFLTAVDDNNGNTTLGPVGDRSLPMPRAGNR